MARKKTTSSTPVSLSPIQIGNCEVFIEGAPKNFNCESHEKSVLITASRTFKIKVSVMEDVNQSNNEVKEEGSESYLDCQFLLVNPKDADSGSKSLIRDILSLYMKELPAMKFAANTGKQSSFLERCVSSGKFCTLLLRSRSIEGSAKVIAAVTYQIIPADTQYVEIPLAAVSSLHQRKGIGQLVYMELKKRLQNVGICTVLCWGDKESEAFWQKQGFVSIAEVDTKGRARRLPIRADIRRAMCFPGGSTLMVSHLNRNLNDTGDYPIKFSLKSPEKPSSSPDVFYSLNGSVKDCDLSASATGLSACQDNLQPQLNGFPESNSTRECQELDENVNIHMVDNSASAEEVARQISSTYERRTKRVWEASLSSLQSKRIKANRADYQSCLDSPLVLDKKQKEECPSNRVPLELEKNISTEKCRPVHAMVACCTKHNIEECAMADTAWVRYEPQTTGKNLNIMLMDIADGAKKAYLTKIIWDLGGAVTTDGSLCTHVLAVKARRTLNFCTALCSGAWVISPNWLKESYREGRFVDEVPFIVNDGDFLAKYRIDVKEAVLRARTNPQALLEEYNVCLTTHVQPPFDTLSAIVRSAGGEVNIGLGKTSDKSRLIYIACEEDMEEALLAVKSGIRTFNSDWLMNCVMKQELDLDAPQFAESL